MFDLSLIQIEEKIINNSINWVNFFMNFANPGHDLNVDFDMMTSLLL